MDDSPHGQSDTPDDILDEVDTKSDANTGLSEPDDEHIGGAVGGVKNQDGELDQLNAQNTTQQTYDNDDDSQLPSDEGKVMEGAVGGATVSCDQCENETAIMYCQNCPGHLCKICYDAHKKSKLTRNHSYINMSPHMLTTNLHVQSDKNVESAICRITCNKHSKKLANSICNTCVYPICSDCVQQHKEHAVVGLEQECIRLLQSTCMDDFQLLLKLVTKLEALQETKSSKDKYTKAIENMALAKHKFDDLAGNGGGHTLVVESLEEEKKEVIDQHNEILSIISNTLDEAKFVMSKLHFAGTTTDKDIVFEALNHFYLHYNTLLTKHDTLLSRKYKKPDNGQLENIRAHIISLERAFDCYKNPCTRYDMLRQSLSRNFRTIFDFVAISKQNFMCITENCYLAYYDVKSRNFGKMTHLNHPTFRLAMLCDTRIVVLTSDLYTVYDENMQMVSFSSRMLGHKTFSAWNLKQIIVLTYADKKFKVFLLNVDKRFHTSTLQFEKSGISGLDEQNNLLVSHNATKDIIIINQELLKLYKFKINGELVMSVDLPINSETYISSFYVDENENLVVGCSNGEVYFVDYKSNKNKLLLSLGRAVTRIGEIDRLLYAFTCYTRSGEGESKSTFHTYEINKSS